MGGRTGGMGGSGMGDDSYGSGNTGSGMGGRTGGMSGSGMGDDSYGVSQRIIPAILNVINFEYSPPAEQVA